MKKKSNRKEKKNSVLNVPDENELNDLERNAKQRSIKISKKKKSIKKNYMEDINLIIKYIYSQKKIKNEGLFLKTLCLESISEFIKMHTAYYKSIEDDKNEISEALISDIGKLDLVRKVIKEIPWGEQDWHID
tara:strand:+ start:642 stop:1040 length:399 start_codon:yes stop_codon:yes gene_type:complete